jgi:hypothetical protein
MRKIARCLALGLILAGSLYAKVRVDRRGIAGSWPAPPITRASASFESDSRRRFALGFENLEADLIWIGLLQGAKHSPLHGAGPSWEYSQLDALTSLDPHFEHAYRFGSAFLSVFRQDKWGAEQILRKWVIHYPRLWQSHYLLAYHAFAEMRDFDLASHEMQVAAGLPGAPGWLSALSVRLWSEQGALLPALQVALQLYPGVEDGEGKRRLRLRIRSLRFALQRAEWDLALRAFRAQYHREPEGLRELAPLVAPTRALAEAEQTADQDDTLKPLLDEKFHFRYDPATRQIESAEKIDPKEWETGILGHRS